MREVGFHTDPVSRPSIAFAAGSEGRSRRGFRRRVYPESRRCYKLVTIVVSQDDKWHYQGATCCDTRALHRRAGPTEHARSPPASVSYVPVKTIQ